MCGIIGYIGPRAAASIILGGLRRLEYRGYDSAGIALLQDNHILVERAVGKLSNLETRMNGSEAQSTRSPAAGTEHLRVGVGHTRWATHGPPSERNAHPHVSMDGKVAVVHNGIVENFIELKRELQSEGVVFNSDTDTEVIVHMVNRYMHAGYDLERAAHATIGQLRGSQAIVLISIEEPDKLIAARIGNAGGVSIGVGNGEMFVASDIPGILEHTRRIIFLDSHEVAVVRSNGVEVRKVGGDSVRKEPHTIAWDPVSAEKGEYRHFMQKEIFEQARAITDTIRGRVDFRSGEVTLENLSIAPDAARRLKRIYTTACGTSAHSGLVGKFLLEGIARVSTEVDYGSEFRYRNPLVGPDMAVLGITQSGETADTLAAMQEAREKGASVWSIVNAVGSQAERVSDGYIAMRAGPEIGVASTKAFTTSIVNQYLLACYLAQQMAADEEPRSMDDRPLHARNLARLPNLVSRVLEPEPLYDELANQFHDRQHFLYLGRGINYPLALEGALKLKEISYIHAEGYPAGEMKHGPIALIDEHMPVLCIAVRDNVYDKMISQIEQVKARNGIVIAVATEGDDTIAHKADYVLWVPETPPLLTPVVTAIPLQRLAYHLAVRRGCDVDQPRNLAKSVTVE
ncbi:MAG: glutamine--fructose-6-phosphate transaminase (isomerizing) [Chloroflexi bacterium]|nr:glutamine--fructose-6-phosphate transaminase (isomerizing) [Chloroflexota bacterium]